MASFSYDANDGRRKQCAPSHAKSVLIGGGTYVFQNIRGGMAGKLNAAGIERIRKRYLDTTRSLLEVAAASKVSVSTVSKLVVRHGWPKRSTDPAVKCPQRSRRVASETNDTAAIGTAARERTGGNVGGSDSATDGVSEAQLVQRLFNAIDASLREIEPETVRRGRKSLSYDQRTRGIATMVRSLEKVLDMKLAQAKGAGNRAAAEKVRLDAEQLRQGIADRLAELQRKRDARG